MKNVLTICAMVLLCHYTTQAQNCMIDAGMDKWTCSFQDTLIGSPTGGSWAILCADTVAPISMEVLNDSSSIVTYSECGTYTFEYMINNDSCNVTDTISIDFEDPSRAVFDVDVDIALDYLNAICASGDSISCDNIYEVPGDAPMPIWSFTPYGDCYSLIYSTTLGDTLEPCVVESVTISTTTHNGTLAPSTPQQYTQNQILTLDDENNIESENVFISGNTAVSTGVSILEDNCPIPLLCHPLPLECLDTLLDTVILEVPIHLGGNWTILEGGNFLLLDSNNVFTIDSVDYWLNVTPSITDYNVTFQVFEITDDSDTVFITGPVSFTFLWEEKWTTDTISHVYENISVKDSCCGCGLTVVRPELEMPPVPDYDCAPFTVTFFPKLLATAPNVICEDSTYYVEVGLSGGIIPYTTSDSTGTIDGTFYTSSSIPQDSVYFSIDFMDSGGCEVTVEGDDCICLTGGDIGVFDLITNQDCGNDGFGKLLINHLSGGTSPFSYSIDSINFQTDTVFANLISDNYTLYIKDSFTCITTLEFTIGSLDWSYQDNETEMEICGNEITLLPLDLNEEILDYYEIQWEDGDTSLFRNIDKAGTYNATVYDLFSCIQFSETFKVKDISIFLDRDVRIPNAFTPNGDGQNDKFAPYFRRSDLEFNYFNLNVFNRWGNQVFQTNDPNEEWLPEGKYTSDVYVWFLEMEIVMCDGEKIFYKKSGDLTLIR